MTTFRPCSSPSPSPTRWQATDWKSAYPFQQINLQWKGALEQFGLQSRSGFRSGPTYRFQEFTKARCVWERDLFFYQPVYCPGCPMISCQCDTHGLGEVRYASINYSNLWGDTVRLLQKNVKWMESANNTTNSLSSALFGLFTFVSTFTKKKLSYYYTFTDNCKCYINHKIM